MATLTQFLQSKFTTSKKAQETHTRIPDEANGIRGGKYVIDPDSIATFHDLYYNEIVLGNRIATFTEKQVKEADRILVDLDFRMTHGTERQWTDDDAWTIINTYMETLKPLVDFKAGQVVKVYYMRKDAVNHLSDGSITKDGIHFIINIKLNRDVQKELRKRVMAMLTADTDSDIKDIFETKLNLTNDLDSVFDKGLTFGGTNWQMIGSRKSATAGLYRVVRQYTYTYDATDGEWGVAGLNDVVPTPLPREVFDNVVRTAPLVEVELTRVGLAIADPQAERQRTRDQDLNRLFGEANTPEDIGKLYQCLSIPKRCASGTYAEWIKVGMATKNSVGEAGCEIWTNWSWENGDKSSDKHDLRDRYARLEVIPPNPTDPKSGGVGIGSLHHWAKEDNPTLYAQLFPRISREVKKRDADEIIADILRQPTDYKIATLFQTLYGEYHVCVSKTKREYYSFTEELMWELDEGGTTIRKKISQKLVPIFTAKVFEIQREIAEMDEGDKDRVERKKKQLEQVSDIIYKLEDANQKDKILKEISDLLLNAKFLDDFNRAVDELPVRPRSVYNMATGEVRPRTIRDKWTYECDAEYLADMSEEDTMKVKTYFLQLFQYREDTMQVVLDVLKSAVSGRTLRHIFFLLGTGRNGKSLLIQLLQAVFGGAVMTISKKVIIDKSKGSDLNTEVEKLDKCRIGTTSEFSNTEKMNVPLLKEISGGDNVELRGMRATEKTIRPTANLFACTNDMPHIKIKNKDDSKAFFDRLIIIPFKATFETDPSFRDKMLALKSQIFTYIMKEGVIRDKFDITDEMRGAVQEYVDDNVNDSIGDFLRMKFERVAYNESTIDTRRRTRVDQKSIVESYNAYCHAVGTTTEKLSSRKWHGELVRYWKLREDETSESGGKRYYHGVRYRADEETRQGGGEDQYGDDVEYGEM